MHWKKLVNKLLIFSPKTKHRGKNEFKKNDKNKIWITSIIIEEK